MRLFTPMTLIVLIALAFCLFAGVAIILRSLRGHRVSAGVCKQCGATVRPPARFCSRCGAETSAGT